MATIDRSTFDAALKDYYLAPMREQVNRATVALDIFKTKENVEVQGKQFIVPLKSQRHPNVVSRSGTNKASNKLPTAAKGTWARATYSMTYHYARIEIDGPVMRSAKSDKGAFVIALDNQIQDVTESMPQEFNRQLHGDGTNKLATSTADGANTVNVAVSSSKFLNPGQLCTFINNASGAIVDQIEISSITSATAIVLAAVATWTAATDGIYPESESTTATAFGNAMTGLGAIVLNTGTVGGINRATAGNEYWKAQVLANSGTARPLSVGLMQQAMLAAETARYGGKRPAWLLAHQDIWATYGNLIIGDKRFSGDVMTLDGGWQYLNFSGAKFVYDKDATEGQILFLPNEHLFFLNQTEMTWMDEDGSILSRVVDYDAYEATLFCDKQFGTDRPASCVLLDDLDTNLA